MFSLEFDCPGGARQKINPNDFSVLLELCTNQVTHFYSERKNTAEMIRLLDILVADYCDMRDALPVLGCGILAHVERVLQENRLEQCEERVWFLAASGACPTSRVRAISKHHRVRFQRYGASL